MMYPKAGQGGGCTPGPASHCQVDLEECAICETARTGHFTCSPAAAEALGMFMPAGVPEQRRLQEDKPAVLSSRSYKEDGL